MRGPLADTAARAFRVHDSRTAAYRARAALDTRAGGGRRVRLGPYHGACAVAPRTLVERTERARPPDVPKAADAMTTPPLPNAPT